MRCQANRKDIDKHYEYFDSIAESIAMIAENINMQMESEYGDLFDRKLMGLYGLQPGKANLADMTVINSKTRTKPFDFGVADRNLEFVDQGDLAHLQPPAEEEAQEVE